MVKYWKIVKGWVLDKANGSPWDLFVLGAAALAILTILSLVISAL